MTTLRSTTVLNLKPPSVNPPPLAKLRRRRKISKPLSKIWKFQTKNLKSLTRDLENFEKSQKHWLQNFEIFGKSRNLDANFRAAGENFWVF